MKTLMLIVATTVLFLFTLIQVPASAQQAQSQTAQNQQVVKTTFPDVGVGLQEVLRKHVPKDVPILEDINITPPDQSVPQGLARLSGAWVGEWRGQRTNKHMSDQLYVFEKVSPTSVTMVSGGIGRFSGGTSSNYGKAWFSRRELQLTDTTPPTVVLTNGNKITFEVKGEQLRALSVHPNGSVNVGSFTKIQP